MRAPAPTLPSKSRHRANARRHSPSPSAIRATAYPREHLARLTERFYRVDTARSRELGGTGLGLAIVKHIVNHHRGLLEIDSELGRGSVFTIHLPTAGAPAAATA